MSALASKRQLSRGHSGKATIRPGNESALKQSLRSHPWLGLPGWTCVCFAFTISRMTIVKRSTSYFACTSPAITAAKFIEYLVPALHLTAIFRALHGFISNEGKFRLAVSNILKRNHVVHIVYGLMFYSLLRRLNPVSLRRFAYVAVSRASQDAMLFTDNAAQLGPQLAVETSKTAVLDAEQVTSIANAVGMSR